MTIGLDEQVDARSTSRRWLVIILLIAAILIWHGATPLTPGWMHAAHILLRKLFVVPILLAAIWFGMRGAVLSATGVSLVYLPYMLVAWSGRPAENLNQGGEVVTFWIVGLLAGWLSTRERRALQHAADMSRDALKALVAALDAREHQTQQHSHRVAELAGAHTARKNSGCCPVNFPKASANLIGQKDVQRHNAPCDHEGNQHKRGQWHHGQVGPASHNVARRQHGLFDSVVHSAG